MFNSDVLEVGIGMSLLFLMMSMIATAMREGIEGLLKHRSKDLEQGLREMLSDTKTGDYSGLVGQLYQHPLINSLYRGTLEKAKKSDLPSYIPSKGFVTALLDILVNANPATAPVTTAGAAGATPKTGVAPLELKDNPVTLASLKACVNDLPDQVRKPILLAIDDAQGDIDAVKSNLAAWFDATMDRVSGWYRRRTQLLLFVIGLCAAIFLNVDSLTVAQHLLSDKSLRQGIVDAAQQVKGTSVTQSAEDLSKAFGNIVLPVGWTQNGNMIYPAAQMCKAGGTQCSYGVGIGIQTVIGWLVTAFAIMLGAPFWFDVLNRFVVIRSTVKPNEKSQVEASKDAMPSPIALLMPQSPPPAAR
jgi:hypothetical protein